LQEARACVAVVPTGDALCIVAGLALGRNSAVPGFKSGPIVPSTRRRRGCAVIRTVGEGSALEILAS